jgi:hypothetical protein
LQAGCRAASNSDAQTNYFGETIVQHDSQARKWRFNRFALSEVTAVENQLDVPKRTAVCKTTKKDSEHAPRIQSASAEEVNRR